MITDPFLHDPLPRTTMSPLSATRYSMAKIEKKKKRRREEKRVKILTNEGNYAFARGKGGRKEEESGGNGGRGTEVTIHGRSQPGENYTVM